VVGGTGTRLGFAAMPSMTLWSRWASIAAPRAIPVAASAAELAESAEALARAICDC